MFIMKKELFHCYAEWLFSILYEVEKHLRLSPYHYAQRVLDLWGNIIALVLLSQTISAFISGGYWG